MGCVLKPSTLYLSYQRRVIALSVLLSGNIVGIKPWVTGAEGSSCILDQEAKMRALHEAAGHLGSRKVGE